MTVPFEETLAYYRYNLPESRIAQEPLERGASRLLVLERRTGRRSHHMFRELPDLLPEGALLVANNSRVLPVRVRGVRPTGGRMECLLLGVVPLVEQQAVGTDDRFTAETDVLLKPGKAVHVGDTLRLPTPDAVNGLDLVVLAKGDFGRHRVRLTWSGGRHGLTAFLEHCGQLPLPPYIRRESRSSDAETYQTVYSRKDKSGSAAAPTAGLHFTDAMRETLARRGFGWAEVTLHVGYGTFSPVRCEDIREHVMHREFIECSQATAEAVSKARAEGRPVIAVGTTACRTLEGIAQCCGSIQPYAGWTDIFIRPGYAFKAIDGLVTNFHLPESTLLMLVCALAGHDPVLAAYKEAVELEYRFFSYGDAMLIR
ncbi:MAG TPA: tRNA preQ1(34) S-adenosylmethionine ribosyltransferase-isomerase QueA [Candidatus Avidesulfovibrio excrementigallinarum]|nr:tRNA preQ1(34) S-adenosylmethionine ribosyltransferase-isomerase QueA [Candidatus Avidesulfovibrio excrementigallinarum]